MLKIDKPDGFYDGYISLGVVEHCKEGPEPFLLEAYRVLNSGGIAFISVPYINALRKAKTEDGFLRCIPTQATYFYQYAFQRNEFGQFLTDAGFKIIEVKGVAGYYALREELSPLFLVLDRIPGNWRLQKFIREKEWTNFLGHMILFICRK